MILSARYSNPENTAAVITTDEHGDVAVSEIDTPELWAELHEWGTPEAYAVPTPPPPPVATVTPLQARKVLRLAGIKEQVDTFIATLTDEEREEWEYCVEVRRDNPIIAKAATALQLTDEHVDQLFATAATL